MAGRVSGLPAGMGIGFADGLGGRMNCRGETFFCTIDDGKFCEDVLDDDIFSAVDCSVEEVACLSGC